MGDFEVHTDGSAIWVECVDCNEKPFEQWSLPVDLDWMVADSKEHICGEAGIGGGADG